MATLNDGLALIRCAAALADLGISELDDETLKVLESLKFDDEVVRLVDGHIPDGLQAREWLGSVWEHARYARSQEEDDIANIVECVAFLGNVIVSSATHQATGSFPAVSQPA